MSQKIIVVDDDEAILDAVTAILTSEGYEVQSFTTGKPLYSLQTDLPNLIILDILLAGEDGKEICNYLKQNDNTKHIPVVLFSAHSQNDMYSALTQIKYDSFIEKPFNIDELIKIVHRLIPN